MIRIPLTPVVLLLAGSTAFAQTNGGTGSGLDKLDEQQVMSTLASNNMETLLDRDFKNYNIPATEQAQMRTLIELRRLTNYRGLPAGQRALAISVAKGLEILLPKTTDPEIILQQAIELTQAGITPTVTALEYFGENPVTQGDLKPVAETAKKLYEQAAMLADKKLTVLAAGIKTNQDFQKVSPLMGKMRNTKGIAEFSDNLQGSYAQCISMPKGDPQRKTLADATIAYLKQFDDPNSTLQPGIRVQIGKLQLLKDDNSGAKLTFDSVLDPKKPTVPPPTVLNENDARYFGIVALIGSRKLNDADKAIPDLENWETANVMPTLKSLSDQDSVKAAMSMLKFRLYSAQSDLANIAAEKQEKNDKAIDVLATLLKSQPRLKDLVFDQLIGRIPEKPDYKDLNPLILQAFQQQGFTEVQKPADAPVDEAKLSRAIDAARELLTRTGQPGADAGNAWRSSYFIAYAYDKLKDGKHAAAAFMDFAEAYPAQKSEANDAMDHAAKWIGVLRKKDPADQDARQLYDRFLPIAIAPPFNRKQFAFGYGALLFEEAKYDKAVEYFEQVPQAEKKYPEAQKMKLLAQYLRLKDPALVGPDRTKVVNQILDLAKVIDAMLANATAPTDKAAYVEWVVIADGVAADVARTELKDPAKSLEILNGYEARIAGSTGAEKAHLNALQLRVSDYLDLKKVQDAVNTVVTLLKENPAQGQDLMFSVLKTVEHEMDIATDPSAKKNLAQAKATLSSFVVDWATKKNDPDLATYQLYDADAKREAAELADNAATRQQGLQDALQEYRALNDRKKDDASLQGIGLVQYDLGLYPQAMTALGALVTGNKVGQPTITIDVGGVPKVVDNPQFWETNFKDLKSVVEVYKSNPKDPKNQQNLEATRQYIGILQLNNGKNFGGATYHDDFEKLKTEIATLQGSTAKPAK